MPMARSALRRHSHLHDLLVQWIPDAAPKPSGSPRLLNKEPLVIAPDPFLAYQFSKGVHIPCLSPRTIGFPAKPTAWNRTDQHNRQERPQAVLIPAEFGLRHFELLWFCSAHGMLLVVQRCHLPNAAPTGAISVEPRFILSGHGGLHHAQGVAEELPWEGSVGGYLVILQFGNSCWSFFTASPVSLVSHSHNSPSWPSPFRFSSPVSVT